MCGVSFFICAVCIVYVCSVLTCSIITSLENVRYIVSYTSHLDIVSYSLLALCEMNVTLLDSSVSFFLFLLMWYLCLFLTHGFTNEYIISIFNF